MFALAKRFARCVKQLWSFTFEFLQTLLEFCIVRQDGGNHQPHLALLHQ